MSSGETTNDPPTKWVDPFVGEFQSKVTLKRGPPTKEDEFESGPIVESTVELIPRAVEALRYAHDIRKFEIDLYWKRSAYFQTVIGIVLGALALTLRTGESTSKWVIDSSMIQAAIAYLGSVLAFAWYSVTRGGKYWQRNWETHVDTLENLITGPLYKTVYNKKSGLPFGHLLKEYPYSTSKLNSFVALVFVVLFFSVQLAFLLFMHGEWFGVPRLPFLISVFASGVTFCLMHLYARFEIGNGKIEGYDIDFHPNQRTFETPQSNAAPENPHS